MSEQSRRRFYRRAFLGIWASATLVLLFMVFLLASELAQHGENPFAIPERTARTGMPGNSGGRNAEEFSLYFASPDGRLLMGQPHRMISNEHTVENCRALLKALIDGPRGTLLATLPSDTAIRGIYALQGGEIVVDLSREVEQGVPRSASAESLMAFSVVNTLTQPGVRGRGDGESDVRRVRFLFEGGPPSDRFPHHISLSDPLGRDESWFAQEGSAPDGNG